MTAFEPVEAANHVVDKYFPQCLTAILASGVLSGARTPTSDLDIVAVLDGPPAPYRQTMTAHGWVVELFVHTRESLHHFFDLDAQDQRCTLARMCTGYVLRDVTDLADSIQLEAQGVIDAGPPELSVEQIDERRYHLTDLLDDFDGANDPDEIIFIAGQLIHQAGGLALASQRRWRGTGKWMVRQLNEAGGDVAGRLAQSFRAFVVTGEKDELHEVVLEVLSLAGGPLTDGYVAKRVE